jgi:anthranilate synthase/aminodeoxychorismate synthase-like glutamine amidotransferase
MILVLDNYDSFTFNLVQYLGEFGLDVMVKRNDAVSAADVGDMAPDAVVISPGPCTPAEAGISVPLVRQWGASIPILGVCLGHQAIVEAYGGRVVRAGRVMHGKTSRILHDGTGLFAGLESPLDVMRYHSLIAEPTTMPDELLVTAVAQDDSSEIHAVQHRTHPVWGVQFHPESIMTPRGKDLLANFLKLAGVSVAPASV